MHALTRFVSRSQGKIKRVPILKQVFSLFFALRHSFPPLASLHFFAWSKHRKYTSPSFFSVKLPRKCLLSRLARQSSTESLRPTNNGQSVTRLTSLWGPSVTKTTASFECRKTKTKVITLANQKGRRQSSKPIKTRGNYT